MRSSTKKQTVVPERAATMAEIAAACGVSRATVSYVLNRSPRMKTLSVATIALIEKMADRMLYRANDAARAIKTGRARTLAIFTPPLRFESNILVVHGAALAGVEMGYQVKYLPVPTGEDAADALIKTCRDRLIGGAICLNLPRPLLVELSRRATEAGILLAQVGDCFPEVGDFSVVADHFAGTREVINHLVSLGHRRIALMMNDASYSSSVMRLEGFEKALDAHGMKVPSTLRRTTRFQPELIRQETIKLLRLKQPPTAIVCDTDPVALSVLHTLQAEGLKVPHDISVTGYVNLPFCEFTQPRLTSVDIPAEILGHQVAARLIARLENQPEPPLSPPLPRLIIRESSGPEPRK